MQLKNYFLYVIAVSMLFSCEPTPQAKVEPDSTPKKAAYSGPPYTIKLEEFVNPAIPGLHSYIHAVYEDKLIMIGGRTNGLHMNYNFSLEHANQKIYVVDTRNWGDPSDWEVHSMAYSQVKGIDNAQFRSNNAQFFQEKGVLYIVGGLEYANVATSARHREGKVELILAPGKTLDGKPAKAPTTLPYMTAVNLDDLVLAVMSSGTLAPPNVRQVKNDSLAVTGGELEVIKGKVFLVFGWNFGANTADYTHEIRTFTYSDDGNTLGLGPITVCPTCWDGETPPSNLGNFRRRDGSMSPIIDVRDESEGLMFFSGVFKGGNTHFVTPVLINADSAKELSFRMRWSVYTCQLVTAYSKAQKSTYATFLGGMTYTKYTGDAFNIPVELTEENAPALSTTIPNFGSIPQSNAFTTMVMQDGKPIRQYLLADSFPALASPLILPAVGDSIAADTLKKGSITYNGSESQLFWTLNDGLLAREGVVDYDKFIQAHPQGGLIGYLHGGIESAQANVFGLGGQTLHLSVASKRLFKVKLVPLDL